MDLQGESPPYSVVGAFLGEQVGSFVIIAQGILSSDCQNAILNTRSRRPGKRATALNKGSASANQDEGHDSHHLECHWIANQQVEFHRCHLPYSVVGVEHCSAWLLLYYTRFSKRPSGRFFRTQNAVSEIVLVGLLTIFVVM